MTARFLDVSESEIDQFKQNAVPQNTKDATKFGPTFESPTIFQKCVSFYFIFSNNHQYNYTKTISRLRRRNIGE